MKIFDWLEKYLLSLIIFLVPVAVLGIFANPFEVPKVAVLIFGVTILLLIYSAKALIKGSISLSVSNFDLPVLLLGITYLVSGILRTPNKMEAFFVPGVASVVIFGALFYFLLNNTEGVKKLTSPLLTLAAALSSIVTSSNRSSTPCRSVFSSGKR